MFGDPFHIVFVFIVFIQIHLNYCFLPNDKAHAIPADIGTTVKPTPTTDKIADVLVAPKMTTVSIDSNIEIRVLYFWCLVFDF